MATEKQAEKTVNVRVLDGGPLHIEIAIPSKDPDATGPAARKYLVIPGAKDPAAARGVQVPASEWDLAKVKPMVKGLLDAGSLLASA